MELLIPDKLGSPMTQGRAKDRVMVHPLVVLSLEVLHKGRAAVVEHPEAYQVLPRVARTGSGNFLSELGGLKGQMGSPQVLRQAWGPYHHLSAQLGV